MKKTKLLSRDTKKNWKTRNECTPSSWTGDWTLKRSQWSLNQSSNIMQYQ